MRCTVVGLVVVAAALVGCKGETQQAELEEQARAQAAGGSSELYFAYPGDGQNSVPPSTPLFLRFGGTVNTSLEQLGKDEITDHLRLEQVNGGSGPVALEGVTLLDGGQGIRAEPAKSLTPGRDYELSISGVTVSGDTVNRTIAFSTAASDRGPLAERMDMAASAEGFEVARITPYAEGDTTSVGSGTDRFPVTDMSTLRVQFTEPVNENSLDYGPGASVRLLDGDGELVKADMLARDHHLTVDPANLLTPGETYQLQLTSGITSTNGGEPLNVDGSKSWRFTPLDSSSPGGERAVQAQKAVTNAGKLALTGREANSVLLGATSLGQNNKTIQEGTVFAELGFVPRFDRDGKSVPLRIERGALLTGSNVEVLVGGEVPAGYGSGEIDVRFISDANGYLMPNPYTDSPDAPRIVRLFLDLAMNTGDKRGNGALAQELLHVELIGTAMVDDGILNLEAVSVIEPDVLGVDKASGLISFKLRTFEDAATAPSREDFADTNAPTLKSWAPGEAHQDKLQPQDAISLFFSEPLMPRTVNKETIWLEKDGSRLGADAYAIRQNGSNVIVDPAQPLDYGANYEVGYDGAALTDLAGNELGTVDADLGFALPATDTGTPADVGPFVVTSRPGYPCAKDDLTASTFDPNEGNGRCLGGMTQTAGDQTSQWIAYPGVDDLLPLERHGSGEPIIVRFSQNMDKTTMTADRDGSGGNFLLETFNENTGNWERVSDYELKPARRMLKVVPVTHWKEGAAYRYTLKDGLQSEKGNPLYTKLLAQFGGDGDGTDGRDYADLTAGGHSMVNRFVAEAPTSDVLTPLGNLPTNDVNSDLAIEDPEAIVALDGDGNTTAVPNSGKVLYNDGSVESDLVDSANIGCRAKEGSSDDAWSDCPRNKFLYNTGKLDVDLVGPAEADGEVLIKLNPTVLMTSPLTVHVYSQTLGATGSDPHQSIVTGPQTMRMRYQEDGDGNRTDLITGIIRENSGGDLIFETELDVYLDAPFMNPTIPNTDLDHNMRSFPINNLKLRGNITFLDDGRMRIEQRNVNPVVLEGVTVDGDTLGGLGTLLADPETVIDLTIPKGELYLNYVTAYTQKRE